MRIWAILFILLLPQLAYAKPLVADLSQYRIEIDSNFTGTRLLLFGSRNDIGDIVAVVRGPEAQFVVRKKARVAGIWVNHEEKTFDEVPSYYAIASSKTFKDIHNPELFGPLRIGLEETVKTPNKKYDEEFGTALIAYEQSRNLYSTAPQKVSFMGESLFKFVLPFPDNIPGGNYSADVYLFNDGQLMGMQSIPLHVVKTGFDALIYDFAHEHSVLYGLLAVLLALGMGWSASRLLQRL